MAIYLKCDLENVTNLGPSNDMIWFVKLKCSNCGEELNMWISITKDEKVSTKGGRGEANLMISCKGCKRDHTIDIIEGGKTITTDKSGSFVPVVSFECRGIEIIDYDPRMGFTCEGTESGTPFEVDLSERDWSDFDDKTSASVGIYNLSYKLEKI